MDAEIERLFVSVGADISGAVSGLNQLEARLGGFQGKVQETGGIWSGFMGGLAKVGLAINGVQQIIGVGERLLGQFEELALTAAQYDASLNRLKTSITNTGVVMTASLNTKLNDNLQAMQDASGFAKTELIPAYSNLVAITGSYQEATDRMALAEDFARGAGIELSTASRLLGKVTDETTTVLARYGIRVEKGATATELLRKVQQKFGGQSKTYMEGVLGQWTKLQNRIEDAKLAMSERLQPAFLKFIDIANKAMDFTGNLFKGWGPSISSAVGLLGNFAGALGEIFDVASADTSILGNAPALDEFKKKGLGADTQAQSQAAMKAAQGGELTKILGPQAAKGFMGGVAKLRDAIRGLWDFIVRTFQEGSRKLQPVLDGVGKQLDNLRGMFEKLPKPIQDFVTTSAVAGAAIDLTWFTIGSTIASLVTNILSIPAALLRSMGAFIAMAGPWLIVAALVAGSIYLIVTHWDDLTEMIRLGAAGIISVFSIIGEAIVNTMLTPLNNVIDLINGIISLKNTLTGSKDALLGHVGVDFSAGKNAFGDTLKDVIAAGNARKAAGGNVGFDPDTQKFIADAVGAAGGGGAKIASLVQNITINGNADSGTVKAFAGATADGLTQLAQVQVRRVGSRPQ